MIACYYEWSILRTKKKAQIDLDHIQLLFVQAFN